ncbi:hypothetical protein [Rubritalea tangerina]|uniref:DUF4349 domain-containing protein n=1 Tax=Rubritalea tangerina TaxID=430798 RepID=A0ABW4Z7N1_9BACT
MNLYKNILTYSAAVVAIYIPAQVGFYFGKQAGRGEGSSEGEERVEQAVAVREVAEAKPVREKSESRVMTAEDLAQAKGVPAVVESAQGNYTLVSVIEGAQLNQQLTDNLQIVRSQRQQLAQLAQQFDQTSAEAVQQRELIAGQINQVKMSLQNNLRVMAQSYSYSLNHTYLRVPHVVSLLAVNEADGQVQSKVVHTFESADAYEAFQKMNDVYQRLRLEEQKQYQEGADKETGEAVAFKPSEQLSKKQEEMIKLYSYDPERQYFLQFEKTAFYAKPARS